MAASIWNPGTSVTQGTPASLPFSFVKGTVGNPGINFVGDTDTGIWSQADGYLNFVVNGVTQLSIDPQGNTVINNLVSGVEQTIAAASTTDIGLVTSNSIQVTGSSTINSFGTNYRGPKYIRFSAGLTINNSAVLVCPGGSNVTIVAGDSCIVIPKATAGVVDGWVIISLTKATSSSATGGGATGAAGNYLFYENDQFMTGSYTISNNKNAATVGPLRIGTGVTLTVPTGARLVVL
jgi:hypothetical protein